MSASRSSAARCWASSAATARARARCSRSCRASPSRAKGRVTIKGRVASLLEVGTGFHPELTGRENIYLNGAILGMTRAEIRRKFDEIVAFAEIEKFLDTPVKRYSSGMYVRLAFAVAAHLEPEILVVDEVLAVGDGEFQKKCLGKMYEVAGGGRTVLFVSHNMAAVSRLCGPALWLVSGTMVAIGPARALIDQYFATTRKDEPRPPFVRRNCGQDFRVEALQLYVNGVPSTSVQLGNLPIFEDPLPPNKNPPWHSYLLFDPPVLKW